MPRGGARVGAGRKPLPRDEMGRIIRHPSSPPVDASLRRAITPPTTNGDSPIEEFDAPDSLTKEERDVWLKQAPHAFKARTLTPATAMAFERYCRVVVLEAAEAKSSGMGGANHRGLLKQINAYELQFCLVPSGKPLVAAPAGAAPAEDDDEAFFGGGPRGQRA